MTRAFLAALCALAATGCKSDSPADPPTRPGPASGSAGSAAPPTGMIAPLMWTVETAGGATSRIFATIDAGLDVDAQVPPAIWDHMKASKTVVLQWNLAEVTMAMLQRTDGSSLATDLTPDESRALATAMGATFVRDLDKSKPSFVATVISAYGLPTRNPLQAVINQRAQDAQLPTVYLETGVAQQALLDRWLDVAAVKAMIARLDAIKATNVEQLAAYVRGDETALAAMIPIQMPWKRAAAGRTGADLEAMTKATHTDRHAAWVTFLAPTLDAGQAFIAVDAVDAIAPGGLIEQLRSAGYRVVLSPRQ
jgi:uncharacterized protein YbaP (TraB family)